MGRCPIEPHVLQQRAYEGSTHIQVSPILPEEAIMSNSVGTRSAPLTISRSTRYRLKIMMVCMAAVLVTAAMNVITIGLAVAMVVVVAATEVVTIATAVNSG